MNDKSFKNKIITLSGEPVTGKGTNVKAIEHKLVEKGYKEENIHIITTGHEFRRYFEIILDFIKNRDDIDKINELAESEEIKSISNNEEYRKKFREELDKIKKANVKFPETLTIEQANNISELAGIREIVDSLIDGNIKKLGEKLSKEERPDEVWIIDSRLAFSNIPDSFKVRLTCLPHVAGQRLLGDNTRGKEDREYKDLEDAINQREKRKNGEIKRYKDRYGVDLADESNYDLIIDTSFASIDDISDTILTCLDRYQKGELVVKRWASPKMMLPAQAPTMTDPQAWPSSEERRLTQVTNSIRENGFDQTYAIEVARFDGLLCIDNGHKRNFGSYKAGKTLIPYVLVNENENGGEGITEEQMKVAKSEGLRVKNEFASTPIYYMYDHEGLIENYDRKKTGNGFNYTDVYPDLMKKIDKIKKDVEKDRKMKTQKDHDER